MEAREIYNRNYESKIQEWSTKVHALEAQAEGLTAQARIDVRPRVDGVRTRLAAANARLHDVTTASDEAWGDAKASADHAWIDLELALQVASDAMKGGESRPLDWDHVKEALRRDWDQTRHDFGLEWGVDLHQDVANTVAQLVGSEPVPPRHVANELDTWTDESAVRFGYGSARSQSYYLQLDWNGSLEESLRVDWEALGTGRPWSEIRLAVRYGWMRGKSGAQS